MTIKDIKEMNGGTLDGLDPDFIEMLKDTPKSFVEDLMKELR